MENREKSFHVGKARMTIYSGTANSLIPKRGSILMPAFLPHSLYLCLVLTLSCSCSASDSASALLANQRVS